jgi:hypothetical protein
MAKKKKVEVVPEPEAVPEVVEVVKKKAPSKKKVKTIPTPEPVVETVVEDIVDVVPEPTPDPITEADDVGSLKKEPITEVSSQKKEPTLAEKLESITEEFLGKLKRKA